MSEPLPCARCGEMIGVYEPLVTFVDGQALTTSRLAQPHAAWLAERCYHRSCFEELRGEAQLPE